MSPYIEFNNPPSLPPTPIELNEFLTWDLPQKESLWGDGLLDPQSITVIGGGSKIGKTIFALNLGLSLAQGKPYLGFPIASPVRVLFVQQEVRDVSVQKRLKSMLAGITIPPDRFYYKGMSGLKIDTPEGIRTLKEWVSTIKPQVLILDPLYKFHSRNENSSQEMLTVIEELDRLREDYGIAVLIVHHHRKPQQGERLGALQLRGSSVLFDYGDSYLTLNYCKKGKDILRLDFELRNAESPSPILIRRDANLWYEGIGILGRKKIDVGVIIKALNDLLDKNVAQKVTQKELIDKMSKEQMVSEATVRRQIKEAIKVGLIIKEQTGKRSQAYLRLPDVKTDVS